MPWLLRLLAVPALFLIVRRQRATAPAIVGDIEKLSLSRRLKLTWALARDKRVPLLVRPALLLPAAYMASPIDLLPDFIPVVGKIDDKFVSSTAYALLARFVPPAVLREHVDRASR
jgi:uncharacterized membrane protein YkvA (DUF1232 family)